MEQLSTAEIGRIVDEVVRRVTSGAAAPAASSSARIGRPESDIAQPHACSCSTSSTNTAAGPATCDCPPPSSTSPAAKAAASPTPSFLKNDPKSSNKEALNQGACRVGTEGCGSPIICNDLAPFIDHTLLKADATEEEVQKLCAEARKHKFASVCVNTSYVELCARLLAGSGVMVCCVVGFPLGAMTADAKAFETRDAIQKGADEIDMVINVGHLRSGNFAYVFDDIRAVVKAAAGHRVKVILETALLDEDEKIAGCVLSKAAGAHFVKTSTGFGPGGATAEDIALMRRIVGDNMGVKASGGIRDCNIAQQMIASGATRLGASASINIVQGKEGRSGY